MGAISSEQNYTVHLKPIGCTRASVKQKNGLFLYSRYKWSANPEVIWIHQWILVELENSVDTPMMKKWLKPKREFYMQKQFVRQAQKNTLCAFKSSTNALRKLLHVFLNPKNSAIVLSSSQFVPRTRDCCHKTSMSDYFTDKVEKRPIMLASWDNSIQRIWNKKRFQEVPPANHHWKLTVKNVWEKGKASYRTTKVRTMKSRIDQSADNENLINSSIINGTFRAVSGCFNVGDNVSHVIFVSPWWRTSRYSTNNHWSSGICQLWECRKENPEFNWNSKVQRWSSRIWQTISWVKLFQK